MDIDYNFLDISFHNHCIIYSFTKNYFLNILILINSYKIYNMSTETLFN